MDAEKRKGCCGRVVVELEAMLGKDTVGSLLVEKDKVSSEFEAAVVVRVGLG